MSVCRIRLPNDATYVRASVRHQGQPAVLQAGQELLLDYVPKKTYPAACDCFTNFGFIPEEYT